MRKYLQPLFFTLYGWLIGIMLSGMFDSILLKILTMCFFIAIFLFLYHNK